jgi:hypothetical protein
MILCSNNVKSCYDCIIHSIASLLLQYLGMQLAPIKSMFSSIQSINYYMRIAFRVSQSKLQGKIEDTLNQGIFQGNGRGPVAWIVTSTLMIDCIKSQGHQITFISAILNTKALAIEYVLVDDTNLAGGKFYDIAFDIVKVAYNIQDTIDI